MTRTIDLFPLPPEFGAGLEEDFDRCRTHYARARGCRDPRNGQVGGKHYGQDIWAPEGTPIYAPCDGTMRYISSAGDYGNWGKFQSAKTEKGIWFAHCRDRLKIGDYAEGEIIGRVGSTGTQSTGPHSHEELHPIWDDFNSVERIYPELIAALGGDDDLTDDERKMLKELHHYLIESKWAETTVQKVEELHHYQIDSQWSERTVQGVEELLKRVPPKP